MPAVKALINKETLKAICDARRVETSYIAQKIGCKPSSKVDAWMSNTAEVLPTFNQAKKIAGCLHIPFAGLYMNPHDIPMKKLPKMINRRTFRGDHSPSESALNIAVFDLLESRDLFLSIKKEFDEDVDPFSVNINMDSSITEVAEAIRRVFGIELAEQFKKPSARQFYLYVRQMIEAKGVYIQCFSGVDLEEARGIAIYEDTLPIIGINENDRPPAKTFSIIHELVHLLKKQSSMCNEFISSFSTNAEEIFCNGVAGELLVPRGALHIKLKNRGLSKGFTIKDIQNLADDFSVSKEVITRRLLDNSIISDVEYATYNDEFRRQIEIEKEEQRTARSEGRASIIPRHPDREAIDRTSSKLCSTLYKGYTKDIFSKQDVSRYLGMSRKYIDKFLREVSKW